MHKQLSFAPRDGDQDNNASEDDFGLAPVDRGVEWESEAGESTDSEIGEESPPEEHGRIGRLNESSSLLGSRVTVKPRPVHRHTLPPGPSKPVTFSSLGISPSLLAALSKMAIRAPTEIQQACIPPLLAGLSLGSGSFGYR
jgi:ATP-dependent RNA helicase DDX49/DBP8